MQDLDSEKLVGRANDLRRSLESYGRYAAEWGRIRDTCEQIERKLLAWERIRNTCKTHFNTDVYEELKAEQKCAWDDIKQKGDRKERAEKDCDRMERRLIKYVAGYDPGSRLITPDRVW